MWHFSSRSNLNSFIFRLCFGCKLSEGLPYYWRFVFISGYKVSLRFLSGLDWAPASLNIGVSFLVSLTTIHVFQYHLKVPLTTFFGRMKNKAAPLGQCSFIRYSTLLKWFFMLAAPPYFHSIAISIYDQVSL